ncbi:MAG: phage baseplate assembly protein V [Bacteroidales bacterium]|nr:phage baseplate assembly protein V [Bacteroidales bacterium]
MHYYIDFLYGDSTTYHASTIPNNNDLHFFISELDYKKELYAPCHLRVEMVHKKPDSPDDFKKILLSSNVTLKVSNGTGTVVLGKNYIVYDCRYKINYETGRTTHRFSLEIYSRDKLLDIHKFSHVYLNKKLGEHIIARTLAEEPLTEGKEDAHKGVPNLGKLNVEFTNDICNLQHTKFKVNEDSEDFYELIHPYRVQYNETFYSFISRLANRCGEFLFFEDGSLHLGILPDDDDVKPLTTADLSAIEYIQKNTENSDNLQVNAFYQNYFNDEITDNVNKESQDKLYYNDDFSYDEFLEVISETDDFMDSMKKELSAAGLLDLIMSIFPSGLVISEDNNTKTPYYTEYLVNVVLKAAAYVAELTSKSEGANKIRRDYFFDKDNSGVEDFCENLQYTEDGASGHQERSQFGVLKKLADKASNLLAEFYDNIRKKEIESSHNIVRLHLKDFSHKPIKLGQYIKVVKYVASGGGDEPIIGEEVVEGYVVGIYCSYIPIDYSIKEEVTVDVCQFIEGGIYPVYHKCREINRISAQSAKVTDADDPLALGRVRIRYPWQDASGSESDSPWIRMAVPLASKDHGRVFFKPNNGDEVMVDYINGNPEKPYVAGSLFRGKKSFSESLRWPDASVIRSYNGQKLVFTGECVSDFFSSLIGDPAITSNLHLVGDAVGWDWLDAWDKGALEFMHGRMTLTDKFGFWSISGDTGKRSISIESKFGDVSIDAFTGITISAPNGDINIEGKNINITASNNINIEAGQAIKKDLDEYEYSMKTLLNDFLGATIGSIDLSFFRCLWDAILPPISGTLKIKSYRNLFLEADTGAIWGKDSDVDLNTIGDTEAEKFNVMFALGDTLLHSMMVYLNVYDIFSLINKKLSIIGCECVTTKLVGDKWSVNGVLDGKTYGYVEDITYSDLFHTSVAARSGNILDRLFTGERRTFLDTKEICDKSLETLKKNVVYENTHANNANNANERQCIVDVVTLFIRIQNLTTYCRNAMLKSSQGDEPSKSCAKEVYKSFISVWNENIDKALIMKSAMANYYLKYIDSYEQQIYELPDDVYPSDLVAIDDSDIKLLDKIEYANPSRWEGTKRIFVAVDDALGTGVKDELTKFTEDIRFTTTSKQNKGGIRMCSSAYNAVELKDGKFEPIKGVAQFSDLDGFKALIKRKINSIK